jgi:hypothetical protein
MRDWRGTKAVISDRVFYVTVNGTHTPKLHATWVEKADEIRIVVRSAASSSDEIIGNAAELRCLHHPDGFVVVKGTRLYLTRGESARAFLFPERTGVPAP